MTSENRPAGSLSASRLERARRHLKSARDLLANDDFADSISRSYYAVFQAARALLATQNLESRKHSGVVALFNQHFVKTGQAAKHFGAVLKDAWRYRELADYSDIAEFTREEAETQLRDAQGFVEEITRLLSEKPDEGE